MGIFQRAHDIVQAKTNKALDAAEKPDEMLDLSYEKMLEQITQVRRALVDLAASKKRLELQQEQFQHTVDHLQDQAKQALSANREDLAKEALSRKAAAQQQIDEMEPQRQQLDEEEQKLTTTLDALQKRVNDFRTQKETLKAQYTAAKAISEVDESTAGISKSFNDSGAALQRAQDKIATMQARSGALDELLESGVLEDVGGGTDDIQKELDKVGKDAQVDNELAALKAQLGTGTAPEPDALAAPAAPERAPEERRPPRSQAGGVLATNRPRRRPARAPVLLEEVPGAVDRHMGLPGRAGNTSAQHLGPAAGAGSPSENAVRSGPAKRGSASTVRRLMRAHSLSGRGPHQRRELAGPGAEGLVGKRRVVGRQDRRRARPIGRPLHEEAGAERRDLLGQALVVEQHLLHGDRAVPVVVHGPGQPAGQRGVGGVQGGVGGHDAAGQRRPRRQHAEPDGAAPVLDHQRDPSGRRASVN